MSAWCREGPLFSIGSHCLLVGNKPIGEGPLVLHKAACWHRKRYYLQSREPEYWLCMCSRLLAQQVQRLPLTFSHWYTKYLCYYMSLLKQEILICSYCTCICCFGSAGRNLSGSIKFNTTVWF